MIVVAKSTAASVEAYLAELPPERREAIATVRQVILDNLPEGYQEEMQFGMIGYVVPLDVLPVTYNKQPLMYAALGSQKNYMALYLMSVYGDAETSQWFVERYRASGKRLDMGKSCVRFRKLEDVPLALVGEAIARTPVADFMAAYQASMKSRTRS